ncbi:MAG: hypothetical protein Kow0026_17460 [Oricola sp.]
MATTEALIVLSLLGCDDAGKQCEYLKAADRRFATIEACQAASESVLSASAGADYPAVVAICAPAAETAGRPVPPEEAGMPVPVDVRQPDFLERIAGVIAGLAPGRETLAAPVDATVRAGGAAVEGAAKVGDAVIVGVRRVAGAVNPFRSPAGEGASRP